MDGTRPAWSTTAIISPPKWTPSPRKHSSPTNFTISYLISNISLSYIRISKKTRSDFYTPKKQVHAIYKSLVTCRKFKANSLSRKVQLSLNPAKVLSKQYPQSSTFHHRQIISDLLKYVVQPLQGTVLIVVSDDRSSNVTFIATHCIHVHLKEQIGAKCDKVCTLKSSIRTLTLRHTPETSYSSLKNTPIPSFPRPRAAILKSSTYVHKFRRPWWRHLICLLLTLKFRRIPEKKPEEF